MASLHQPNIQNPPLPASPDLFASFGETLTFSSLHSIKNQNTSENPKFKSKLQLLDLISTFLTSQKFESYNLYLQAIKLQASQYPASFNIEQFTEFIRNIIEVYRGNSPDIMASQNQTATTYPVSSSVAKAYSLLGEFPVIRVFGYGSLLWKPDFRYSSKQIGFIDGYVRRFNQGNETFRGIPGKPGRVANLEQRIGSQTWGVAYEISGRDNVIKVLNALYEREATCGGYVAMVTTFYPRDYSNKTTEFEHSHNICDASLETVCAMAGKSQEQFSGKGKEPSQMKPTKSVYETAVKTDSSQSNPVPVLLYTATPDKAENSLYIGDASFDTMVHQIVHAHGTAGSNVEYVIKIADFVREFIPQEDDQYLCELDAKIREEILRHPDDFNHHFSLLKPQEILHVLPDGANPMQTVKAS